MHLTHYKIKEVVRNTVFCVASVMMSDSVYINGTNENK